MFQHPGSNEVRENLRVDGREGSATAATPCCRGSVGLRGAAAGGAFHSPSAPPCANHPVMRLRLDRLEAVVDGVTAATPITGAGVHTAGPLVVDIGLGTSGVRWGFGSEAAGPVRVRSVTLVFAVDGAHEPLRLLRHGWQSWSASGGVDTDPAHAVGIPLPRDLYHADPAVPTSPESCGRSGSRCSPIRPIRMYSPTSRVLPARWPTWGSGTSSSTSRTPRRWRAASPTARGRRPSGCERASTRSGAAPATTSFCWAAACRWRPRSAWSTACASARTSRQVGAPARQRPATGLCRLRAGDAQRLPEHAGPCLHAPASLAQRPRLRDAATHEHRPAPRQRHAAGR